MAWWQRSLRELVGGRRVILAGGPPRPWTPLVAVVRADSAPSDVLVVGTERVGAGPQPDAAVVVDDAATRPTGPMALLRAGPRQALADPPPTIVAAVEAFDPDRSGVVFGLFLGESPTFVGRRVVAHRRPAWLALEDKTAVDALLERAGVAPGAVGRRAGRAGRRRVATRSTQAPGRCGQPTPATATTAAVR